MYSLRIHHGSGAVIENLFDTLLEQLGDQESQRQAGVVLAGFDRIDRLARHVQPFGEVALRPAALGAKLAQVVVH